MPEMRAHEVDNTLAKPSITWEIDSRPPVRAANGAAYLVHIYPTSPAIGHRYTLEDRPVVLGRGEDCDIHVNDHAVSRRHARIEPCADGYQVADLGSTNGTFINDRPVRQARLKDGDYLRVGTSIYRFLAGGNVEADYHEEIYRLTIIDALTGIANRRYFQEFLDREMVRCRRHGRPLALVMMDIDCFKAINDQHGHLCGDDTLRNLAACLKGQIRQDELFARYGGEEFAVILVEASHEQALLFAERFREQIEQHPFGYEGKAVPVTISLGVASTTGEETVTAEALIRTADENLYRAKHQGRNRVVG